MEERGFTFEGKVDQNIKGQHNVGNQENHGGRYGYGNRGGYYGYGNHHKLLSLLVLFT
jgi:hypothetical protein